MLLTVASALLGAFLGMNSRNGLMAALVAAALAGAAHFVLLFGSAIVMAFSANPEPMFATLTAIGLRGYGLAYTMGSASSAALVAGILLGVAAIRERRWGDRRHHASPELARIAEVLEATDEASSGGIVTN